MLLRLKDVRVHYGKAEAIQGITVDVEEGSITGLIGANGAGKSTVLKAISGLHPISAGEVWFRDKRIDGIAGHKIVQQGVLQIPERGRLFPFMTVMQNLRLGAYLRKDSGRIKDDLEKIFQRFPVLSLRRNQRAETLSGGERQMLAIGRALMAKPKLLLMDEPSLGLAPLVVQSLATVIREINKEGIGVLLVEQNAGLAFTLTDCVYVLEVGRITLKGKTRELMNDEMVRKAFLGG
ncbi:MAG: ABC transporter ATP-binding protein [Syntrophorhabdales bacterium]|jgi:branched-chain amino acid transport system ATP-binding protein